MNVLSVFSTSAAVCFLVCAVGGGTDVYVSTALTSNVVADAGSEAAPPGDDAPLKQLSVDAARVYADDWSRCVSRKRPQCHSDEEHSSMKKY